MLKFRAVVGCVFFCVSLLIAVSSPHRASLASVSPTVTYYGGAEQVAGSLAYVDLGDFSFLVDCGSTYNANATGEEHVHEHQRKNPIRDELLPKHVVDADAIFLTHAHLDHSGLIPEIISRGFDGEIYATAETVELCQVMLVMAIRYAPMEARKWKWSSRSEEKGYIKAHWVDECEWSQKISGRNYQQFRGRLEELDDFVEGIDISPCKVCANLILQPIMERFEIVALGKEQRVCEAVSVMPLDAGHIPGSVSYLFGIGAGDSYVSVIFSGDLGNELSKMFEGPSPAPAADYVFVESTYGDHEREPEVAGEFDRFRQTLAGVVADGGVVWIPSFALDRSQKVLLEIALAKEQELLPEDTKVFFPSPSAREITEIYSEHPYWFDREAIDLVSHEYQSSVRSLGDFEQFSPAPGSIIITTSGMMDAAFSAGLISKLAPRDDVSIFFVGYQSPHTYGGLIRAGAETLDIDGSRVPVRMQVEKFSCFSGHGDAVDIDGWLCNNTGAHIGLVHGDLDSLDARQRDLTEKGFDDVSVVRIGNAISMQVREELAY